MDILTIIYLSSALATLGVAFDLVVKLTKLRTAVHLKMKTWWHKLDKTQIPDFPILMADWVITTGKRIFRWPVWSWKTAVSCITASWALTSAAALFGYLPHLFKYTYLPSSPIPLPIWTIYIANFIPDMATILITAGALIIVKNRRRYIGILAIIGDILIATALATISWGLIMWGSNVAFEYDLLGSSIDNDIKNKYLMNSTIWRDFISNEGFGEQAYTKLIDKEFGNIFYCISKAPKYFFEMIYYGYIKRDTETFIIEVTETSEYNEYRYLKNTELLLKEESKKKRYYSYSYNIEPSYWFITSISLTTLIPVFLYMSLLIVMIIAKLVLQIVRLFSIKFFENIVPQDAKEVMPATLFALLFLFLALIAKIVESIIKICQSSQPPLPL